MFSQTHLLCRPVLMMTNITPSFSSFRSPEQKMKQPRGINILCFRVQDNNRTRKQLSAICNQQHVLSKGSQEKIKKMFDKVELSVSSYDTAWVAMVPSPSSSETPCFPECLNWVLENQLDDGSWGLLHQGHPLLLKDALSSTLACVLALRRWGVGEEQIRKGLRFIKSNFASSADETQHSPIGFDIIFPGMIEYAKEMHIDLDLEPSVIDGMLRTRDSEIKRLQSSSKGRKKAYLAYISEGVGKFQDWEMVMKYQKKDGSLFNSPSATAAAVIHLKDPPGCLNYLRSAVKVFGNAVSTVYPLNVYTRLCMVDNLVNLGIDRHFTKEIKMVLDMTYRSWLEKDEEIFSDVTTCAIAFRILLLNGYGVSPDPLIEYFKDGYMNIFSGNMDHMSAALEVYKALELITTLDELDEAAATMDLTYLWCRKVFKRKLFRSSHTEKFRLEVNDALRFPYYVSLERITNRRYIEQHYDKDWIGLQKTSYRCPNVSNNDFLKLAMEDFNVCQLVQRQELKDLHKWVVENKLDRLDTRVKLSHFYFSSAATFFSPELQDSRILWTKAVVLETLMDDVFDVGDSQEEMLNIVEFIRKWDVDLDSDCCSDRVRILVSAIRSLIRDTVDKANRCQGTDTTEQIVELVSNITPSSFFPAWAACCHLIWAVCCQAHKMRWSDLINAYYKGAAWRINKVVPTMDEYIANGCLSIGIQPNLVPCNYFLGIKVPEEMFKSTEYHDMLHHIDICARLLNDIQSYERDGEEGDLNAVSLYMIHKKDATMSKAEAVEAIKKIVDRNGKKLFQLLFTANQEKDTSSAVPRACKDLLWTIYRIVQHFYWKADGFTPNAFQSLKNEMWNVPIVLGDVLDEL